MLTPDERKRFRQLIAELKSTYDMNFTAGDGTKVCYVRLSVPSIQQWLMFEEFLGEEERGWQVWLVVTCDQATCPHAATAPAQHWLS